MKLPLSGYPDDETLLEPNAVECPECEELHEDVDIEEAEDGICPKNAGHLGLPVHVSKAPRIGSSLDRDFYHYGRRQYEYVLEAS